MATAIFESRIDSNLGENFSPKSFSSAQKSDSFEFRNLVKEKISQQKPESNSSETSAEVAPVELVVESRSSKTQSGGKEVVQENLEDTPIVEDAAITIGEEVAVESVITPLPLPVIEFALSEEAEAVIIEEDDFEEVAVVEEDLFEEEVAADLFEEAALITEAKAPVIKAAEPFAAKLDTIEEAVAIPLENAVIVEQNVISPVALPSVAIIQENVAAVEGIVAPLDLTKLSSQEQAMHQNLKTFDLPNTLESSVGDNELLFDEPAVSIPSEESRKLGELLTKLDTPVKIKVETVPEEVAAKIKPVVIPSLNLALADTTRHGSAVISRMQAPDNAKPEAVTASVGSEIILDTEAMLLDLGGKNDNSNSRSSLPLSAFGAVMHQTSDETFNVTFKGQLSGSQNNTPKPAEQVSLAVKEVLNSSSVDGKKQITINLHPQTLGAIKVEILSQMGQDGASKVESIKISAEKNETLVMLEERKAELAKSLKEVTNTKEEASLQFEMNQNHGKGHRAAYFDSLEERNAWMSKFVGLVAEDDSLPGSSKLDEYATRGIATEDKVDLVA